MGNIGWLSVPKDWISSFGEIVKFCSRIVADVFSLRPEQGQSLADYLDARSAQRIGPPVKPDPRDMQGFAEFFARHQRGLVIERAAVEAL